MDVRLFDDAGLFAQEAGAYFEADPFSASVIAVHVAGRVAGVRSQAPGDMWATVVGDGGRRGGDAHPAPQAVLGPDAPRSCRRAGRDARSCQSPVAWRERRAVFCDDLR
jgi:hypothetical protein